MHRPFEVTSKIDSAPLHLATRSEQLRLLYGRLPASLVATVVLGCLVDMVLWHQVSQRALVVWLLVLIAICGIRLWLWRRYQHISAAQGEFDGNCYRPLFITTLMAGMTWGASSLFFFPDNDVHRAFLAFVIAGVSSGAVTSLAIDRRMAWAFILPCVMPLSAQLLLHPGATNLTMGIMTLMYIALLSSNVQHAHEQLVETIRLRFQTESSRLKLADANARLRMILDAGQQVSIITTDLNGLIVDFNRGAERMLGYTAEEMLGKSISGSLHLAQEIASRSAELTALHGRSIEGFETFVYATRHGGSEERMWTYICKDGQHLTVNLIVSGAYNDAGVLVGFLGVAIDVTEKHRAQAQLEAFVEYAPAAVAMFDRDIRYITYSKRWLTDYELQDETLIGRSHYEVFPETSNEWKEIHQRCIAGAVENCDEEMFVRTSGATQWLRWEVRPWRDLLGNIGGIVMFTEDITSRRAIATALRTQDELLRKLSDRVPGMIIQTRIPVSGPQVVQYVSEGVRNIYELETAEVKADNKKILHRIHRDDIKRVKATFIQAIAERQVWRCDYRAVLPIRGLRWLHSEASCETQDDGSVLTYAHVADITELKNSEEHLRVLNDRMEIAAQSVGIGVWEVDLATKQFVLDERMYEIYGLPFDSIPKVTSDLSRRIRSNDRKRVAREYVKAINETKRFDTQFHIVRDDGQERVIRSAALVRDDEAGNATHITGINLDVTELTIVERMKSEFVSIVSHELRTPLTSIKGSLGLVVGGVAGPLPDKAKYLVEMACRNIERLNLLINDLLDIDKLEAGKLQFNTEPQAIMPLISQSLEENAGYAITHQVEFKVLQTAPLFVDVDAPRFLQVMANLLSNASKFSPPQSWVEISVAKNAQQARVEVRDYGPGIPKKFHSSIFQKFCQAESNDARSKSGTGLGLAISKGIIECMGGHIGFDTEEGKGTVFFFELPIALPSAKAGSELSGL